MWQSLFPIVFSNTSEERWKTLGGLVWYVVGGFKWMSWGLLRKDRRTGWHPHVEGRCPEGNRAHRPVWHAADLGEIESRRGLHPPDGLEHPMIWRQKRRDVKLGRVVCDAGTVQRGLLSSVGPSAWLSGLPQNGTTWQQATQIQGSCLEHDPPCRCTNRSPRGFRSV